MAQDFAKALPRKRFFVEMFTRDIAVDDCVLDLVDNSIDALIRNDHIDLQELLLKPPPALGTIAALIEVTIGPDQICVKDNAGGMEIAKARDEVFNFGHSAKGLRELTPEGIGAYGIGLKRAIFKIGREFEVTSCHRGICFLVKDDLDSWVEDDDKLEDWRFPLSQVPNSQFDAKGGTIVSIRRLNEPIATLAGKAKFLEDMELSIARTYSPFLDRVVRLKLNGRFVAPEEIPLTASQSFYSREIYIDEDVAVRLVAGLATRGPKDEWQMEKAGWYVLCNGRIVVFADKTELTGWGGEIMPQFHRGKARGFIGVAIFSSSSPLKLPWTTTKRGLNRESPVFRRARMRMQTVARPVYRYLESLYPSGADATPAERAIAKDLKPASIGSLFDDSPVSFQRSAKRKKKNEARIAYNVMRKILEDVKEHIGDHRMTNPQVGLHTFNYYVEQEGIDE